MYKVWRSRASNPWEIIASGLTQTSYIDTQVTYSSWKGSMFGYKVNAYNSCGNSGYSNDEWIWGNTGGGGPIPKTIADLSKGESLPQNYSAKAYPNPFNTSTKILYGLPEHSYVILTIYDIVGREILTLVNYHQEAGIKELQWNGKDVLGNQVPSGMYILQMVAIADESKYVYRKTSKLLLLQ